MSARRALASIRPWAISKSSFHRSTTLLETARDEDLLQSIKDRIERNKRVLKRHATSHYKARELGTNLSNLQQSMAAVQKKQKNAEPLNSICNIPGQVSIEIVGNGTGLIRGCVVVRTPLKTYFFNCPENTCRFLWQLRLRGTNIMDIFVTSATWDNIAGISSILLSKETGAQETRLHGAMNIKHFLECIRPFQDSDYGSCKYPSQIEERPYTMEFYEDAAMRVSYIPMSPPVNEATNGKKVSEVDIAYLIELKEAPRRIDPLKLMKLKVPKGPLIGQLKNGKEVALPDGRIIKPDEVLSDDSPREEAPTALIVECRSESHAKALLGSATLQPYLNGKKVLNYFVHLSNDAILKADGYQELFSKFPSTEHMVLNDSNPEVPAVESVYRHSRLLRHAAPSLFPELHPKNFNSLVTQNSELAVKEQLYQRVAPLQRFWMRQGNTANEEPIIADLRDVSHEISEQTMKKIEEFRNEESKVKKTAEYPKVSFLGTSSAVPSKYRNVTGYLVEASEDAALLVDVGEGTFGQMRTLLGEKECKKLLVNLNLVLVTHAHQDHMNGLYTIVERRREAFEELGIAYRPLVLVCNRNVLKPLKTYSMCFDDIQTLLEIVDISRHPVTPPMSPSRGDQKRRLPSPHLPPSRDILGELPEKLVTPAWKLTELKAVQVHHTRMANGFVIGLGGKRLVFSGDTKPCELLCVEGEGADLLVHEATFEDGHEVDAMRKKHSTMGQAVDVSKKMKAKNTILTHFSARYPKVPALPQYLDDLSIGVAMDMMQVRFDHLSLVPKLLPVYREMFVEELFEITVKKEHKELKRKMAAEAESAVAEAKIKKTVKS